MKKIISWNINSIKKRLSQVQEILEKYKPDYLLLQETRINELDFPLIHEKYFSYIHSGEKGRCGVAIISKNPMEIVKKAEGRYIECKDKDYTIATIYVHNGGSKYSPVCEKIRFLEELYNNTKEKTKFIIGGDFNVFYKKNECTTLDPFSEKEKILLKKLERILEYKVIKSPHLTWWDYRYNSFNRNIGMGIDKIYVTKDLKSYSSNIVLSEYRSSKNPSDHAPILITVE